MTVTETLTALRERIRVLEFENDRILRCLKDAAERAEVVRQLAERLHGIVKGRKIQ